MATSTSRTRSVPGRLLSFLLAQTKQTHTQVFPAASILASPDSNLEFKMAAFRKALNPLARAAAAARPTLLGGTPTRSVRPAQTRLLNTATAPVLYSAHARVVGARTGHIEGDDLNVDLTMAKSLGGAGDKGKTNPEELFAAGYGACFQSAMNASAASLGIKMPIKKDDSIVDATVHLVGDMKKLDMGIRVDMKVMVKGLERSELEKVVKKAEEVCPYSRATKGNVETKIEIVAV